MIMDDVGAGARGSTPESQPNPTTSNVTMPFLSIAVDLISFLLRIASLVEFLSHHWE